MRKRAKHQKQIFKLRYLVYLALVTSVIGSTTLARFATIANPTAQAVIAAFVSDTTSTLDLGQQVALAPGEKKEIVFTVKNNDGVKICEVPVVYEMQFETTKNLPLVFSLEGEKSDTLDEGLSKTVGALNQDTLLATGGRLPSAASGNGKKISHTYTLKVSWPDNINSDEYSGEIDHLAVTIKTRQAAVGD